MTKKHIFNVSIAFLHLDVAKAHRFAVVMTTIDLADLQHVDHLFVLVDPDGGHLAERVPAEVLHDTHSVDLRLRTREKPLKHESKHLHSLRIILLPIIVT